MNLKRSVLDRFSTRPNNASAKISAFEAPERRNSKSIIVAGIYQEEQKMSDYSESDDSYEQ